MLYPVIILVKNMNNSKIDIIKKKNIKLQEKIEELRNTISNQQLEINKYKNYSNIDIDDLSDSMLSEWQNSLILLNEYQEKYDRLINELRECLKIMKYVGIKIPWYKKCLLTITNKLRK